MDTNGNGLCRLFIRMVMGDGPGKAGGDGPGATFAGYKETMQQVPVLPKVRFY
jgi:hypothetical protein